MYLGIPNHEIQKLGDPVPIYDDDALAIINGIFACVSRVSTEWLLGGRLAFAPLIPSPH